MCTGSQGRAEDRGGEGPQCAQEADGVSDEAGHCDDPYPSTQSSVASNNESEHPKIPPKPSQLPAAKVKDSSKVRSG